MPHPKYGKNQLDFKIYMLNLLKKIYQKKSNIQEACQTLKIIGVANSSHIILFRFLPISGHYNWRKKFVSIISKGKIFRAYNKNPYIVNYWWTGVSNYFYSTILVITKIYIFLHLYFTSVYAKPTCLDCVHSNIYSCILSLLKLQGTF